MNLLKKLLGKKKNSTKKAPSAADSIDQLSKNLEMLEMREKQLQEKVSGEAEKAKEYAKLKNKTAAIQSLKKKKLYEAQIQQLVNSQLRLHDQVITLENAKATYDTIDALKSGSATVQALQQGLSIDEIQKVIGEDTRENFESIKEIQDLLSNPVGITEDFNEDDFEAELEKLEVQILERELPTSPFPHDTVSERNKKLDVDSSELPAAPLHPKAVSQSINDAVTLSELHSAQPAKRTGILSIDNVNELSATQPTRRKISRSISNVVTKSQLPVTPLARNTVSRSITNVGQHSSHLPAIVPTQKTASQSITTFDEFPQVPATPVTCNTRNMNEQVALRPAQVSRRTVRQSVD
ncbi:vacuolar protein sorting-associated protein 32 2-like isoform X2 [Carex littledalei]|uniref:Vacuolar protein sorting-associated protein 32 2-like isoform X2 n=1 Tax=Carex littledalei TaxID=544730 RepID=A0A833QQB8_9POAL|nr:vacuolar protein sorting-associated protein 32 2-like isoform X2 [Carex littledalei]